MAIKSFVTIKPFKISSKLDEDFNAIRKGINRTGVVTEGIAHNFFETNTIIEFQRDWLRTDIAEKTEKLDDKDKKDKSIWKKGIDSFRKMFRKKKRDKVEKTLEEAEKEADKPVKKRWDTIKKPFEGFFKRIGGFLEAIIGGFLLYGIFDWMDKDPGKAEKVFKLIFAIGKFAFSILGFGINGIMNGLTNIFGSFEENPVKRGLRAFLGVFQLLGGIAAFKTAQYLLMPWKAISDFNGIRETFARNTQTQEEIKQSAASRRTGYRDKKTGVIYSKEEYEKIQKSARRADLKRGKQAGKGMKSDLYQKQAQDRFQGQFKGAKKGPLSKLQQRGRIMGKKGLKFGKKGFGKVGKFAKARPGAAAGGLSVLGGAARIASGIASGEKKSAAIGAGVGQAAGGLIGGAVGTALLGPFLGPFAPIVGNAIGGFLGEWVGKTLGPIIEPIFGPLGKMFKMWGQVIWGVMKEVFAPFKETFDALMGFLSGIGDLLMKGAKMIGNFISFVFGAAVDAIKWIIGQVINGVKNLIAFAKNPIGFAWKVIRTRGKVLQMGQEKAEGGAVPVYGTMKDIYPVTTPQDYSMGGLVKAVLAGSPMFAKPMEEGGHLITSPMGERDFKLSPGMHMGVDIATEIGEAVVAMSDGFVEAVGKDSGYGFWISWVDDKGYGHFFAHLDKMPTHQKGTKTPKGTVLGYTGNSGKSSGPHLHWEMALDPKHTGRPKTDVLSRVNPLDFYDKEAPFGGTTVKVEKVTKELSFDMPHGVKSAVPKVLDAAIGAWNNTYGKVIPSLKISPPNFSGKVQKIKEKAQRDHDDEMMPLVVKGETTVVTEQVINNNGGTNVIPVYSPSSAMLS
tara:strand:+ start:5184 stop:7715 length:2532 start_codon:yes stop_codon:yes gene_type:complete